MADSLFDLKTIASGQAEPVGGNRLVIGDQQVATVKKGLLGSSTRAVRERSTVKDTWQGRAEEIADLDGLSIEAQRAVSAAGSSKPDETFLVIAFDDGAFDDSHWILQGDVVDVGSAAAALTEPTGAAATAGPSSSAPPRRHGTRKPVLIIVMAGVALIGVLAALIFVLLAPASEDSGSDATPEPAEQAVEADERPAPVEAADSAEASLLERGPFEPGGLPAMATAIQRELGSVPRFVRIVATPTFAQLQVRLPGEGTFVDEWQWRDGELSDPEPVKVAIPERVPEASFTRREVRLAVLPRVVARAERIPIQDAEVTSAVIERAIPFEPGVRFLVNVSGTREDVQLRANSLGQVTEILR